MPVNTKKNITLAGVSLAVLCASAVTSITGDNSLNMNISNASLYSYPEESASYSTAHSENGCDTATAAFNGITVFVSSTGKYHATANCSGMEDYTEMEIGAATAAGHSPCGHCFDDLPAESTEIPYEETIEISEEAIVIYDAPRENVYVSSSGKYHAKSDCSGMKHSTEMSLDAAVNAGHSPCQKCYDTAPSATEAVLQENADISVIAENIVYVSSSGKYHTLSDCSGMKRYTEMTLSEAVAAEYAACQKCTS